MAYEETGVAVSKSQSQIRNLIMAHKGTGVMLVSKPPQEGFEAMVSVGDLPYHIRVMAICKKIATFDRNGRTRNQKIMQSMREGEERRVWRVLYWHLKALFEAADSGVIDVRDVIMPYVVLADGRTLAEHIKPRMPKLMELPTTEGILPAERQLSA
jgi:hypothetical protein